MTSVSRGIMSRFVSHNELTLSLRAAVAAPPRPSLLFEHTVGDSAIGAHRGGGRLLPALSVGTAAPRPVRPLPPRRAPPACLRVSLATRPAVPAAAAAVDCPRCPWTGARKNPPSVFAVFLLILFLTSFYYNLF